MICLKGLLQQFCFCVKCIKEIERKSKNRIKIRINIVRYINYAQKVLKGVGHYDMIRAE